MFLVFLYYVFISFCFIFYLSDPTAASHVCDDLCTVSVDMPVCAYVWLHLTRPGPASQLGSAGFGWRVIHKHKQTGLSTRTQVAQVMTDK